MLTGENKRALRHYNMFMENKAKIERKQEIIKQPNAYHLILSEHMSKDKFKPKTSLEMFQRQIDINDLMKQDFDINDSILADEPMELRQEQEYYDSRFIEEYETVIENMLEEDE